MKKLILLTAILVCSAAASAQEHFTFRDIPIDGTEVKMGAKLEELGFKPTDNTGVYTGKFIGEDCRVILLSSDYTGNVYSVVVSFDAATRWTSLKSDYNRIKQMYSDKYGKPGRSLEKFDNPYYDGDGYELSAIKNNKCSYIALWDVDYGTIMMTIGKDCSILLYYSDKLNEQLDKEMKERSARSEI